MKRFSTFFIVYLYRIDFNESINTQTYVSNIMHMQ